MTVSGTITSPTLAVTIPTTSAVAGTITSPTVTAPITTPNVGVTIQSPTVAVTLDFDAPTLAGDLTAVPRLDRVTKTPASTVTMTNSTIKVGQQFRQPAISVSAVKMRLDTVTTGAVLECRIETLNSSGSPSGTLMHANAYGTLTIADGDDYTSPVFTLAGTVTLADATPYAIVVQTSSGSPSNIRFTASQDPATSWCMPSSQRYASGAWGSNTDAAVGFSLLNAATGLYETPIGIPSWREVTETAGTSASTPDEAGLRFPSFPYAATFRGALVTVGSTNSQFEIVLYDSSSTVLSTTTVYTEERGSASASLLWVPMPSVTLLYNGDYRLAIKLGSSTLNYYVQTDVAAADESVTAYYTARTNAGAWTNTTTDRVALAMLVEA